MFYAKTFAKMLQTILQMFWHVEQMLKIGGCCMKNKTLKHFTTFLQIFYFTSNYM